VPVWRCAHDCLGADIAAGAGTAFDDEWLSEPFGQPLADQTRQDVADPPGGKPTIQRTGCDG